MADPRPPSDIPLQPEQKTSTDLASVDIGRLLPDLEVYNRQFSIGFMMFQVIDERVHEPEEGPREKTPPLTPEDIYRRHIFEFESTGLSLEPVRGPGTMFGPEGEQSSSVMRLNLSDGKKFQEYLQALKPGEITPSQAEGLKTVTQLLTQQLISEYRLADPTDERLMELFGNVSSIIQRYRELDPDGLNGLASSVEGLSNLWEIAKMKYLREYLAVQQEGLLNGDKFFGPAAWHTDANVDFYMTRWKNAVALARAVGNNPNATKLQRETIDSLIDSALMAQEDLKRRIAKEGKYADEKYSYYEEQNPDFLIVAEESLKQLQQLKAEIEQKRVG